MNRLAIYVVHKPKLILALSALLLLVGSILGMQAFSVLKSEGFQDPTADSTLARQAIKNSGAVDHNLVVLITANHGDINSSTAITKASDVIRELQKNSSVSAIQSYSQLPGTAMRSTNGRQGLIVAHIAGSMEAAGKTAQEIATKISTKTGDTHVQVGGEALVNAQLTDQVGKSLALAEGIAIPLTLIFLLVAFGTLVSALLPLLVALFSVFMTFALLAIIGRITDVSVYSINLITALGLGLAVDYALFIVSRYREELRHTKSIDMAIQKTMHTAGKTVLFSAIAVGAALSAMTIFPLYFLSSFGYAGIGVVAMSAGAALIILPAILKLLGRRIEAVRMPWARRVLAVETPLWRHVAQRVVRHPFITTVPVIGIFIFLALPIGHITFGLPDDRVLTPDNSARQVSNALRDNFTTNSGGELTGSIANTSEGTSLAKAISQQANVVSVQTAGKTYIDGHIQPGMPSDNNVLTIQTNLDSQSTKADTLVKAIRALPQASQAGLKLGGEAAVLVDTKAAIAHKLPLGIAIIALTTYIVLFLFSGSLLQPLRALLTNILTLAASFGLIVWIFQDGNLSHLLNFTAMPINLSMPVLLFCIAFGLSMDYEMFLLSRIKEQHDAGANNNVAVEHGLARAGRIVSTAAVILAVSFFAFAPTTISFLQLFGIGTGLAILLDATLVRGVLVPVFMHAFGDAAWYAPHWMKRIHDKFGLTD
jgi:RND superfamily putative drug exporter